MQGASRLHEGLPGGVLGARKALLGRARSEVAPQTAETNRLEWRIFAASTLLTAKALAAGPHPRRELTLMPRFGFSCPQLGMAAGAPLRGG